MQIKKKQLFFKELPHDLIFSTVGLLELKHLMKERTEVLDALHRAIPKLKNSSLSDIESYLDSMDDPQRMQGVINSVQGVLGEFEAQEYFETLGYNTSLPTDIFNPGFDIALYDEYNDLVDVVQIKTTPYPSIVTEHLIKYPDIPAYVTEDVYNKLDAHPNIQKLPFSSEEIESRIEDTFGHIDSIETPAIGTLFEGGLYSLAISTALNGLILYNNEFSWEKMGGLAIHSAKRTTVKTLGAGFGSVFGPVGMVGMGYVFGKIFDYYNLKSRYDLAVPDSAYSIKVNEFIYRQNPNIKYLSNEAKEMVLDASNISDYDGYNVYNLIHMQNFYGDNSKEEKDNLKKIMSIASLRELIMDVGMINEKAIINKLPELAYQYTLFTNAYVIASAFGNNERSIMQLLNEILLLNGTSLVLFQSYIDSLPKKDGWEEYKTKGKDY